MITKNLREGLKQDLTNYKAIPFWSWNNELDETELVKQIDQMHQAGMGGFIMHARLGLTTEYLGEKWFSCVKACLNRAKQLKMNAWIYDENGWPSGFVGGKLLENHDYRAQFLEYAVKDEFDKNAHAVFVQTPSGYTRITAPLGEQNKYHTVYLRTSPANTDILNPEVVDAFIEQTHEQYYKRFKDSFGKELVGFFTDEPQYYRWATPYSKVIATTYAQKYEEDIKEGLIWLFNHDERGYEFRLRYYTIANDLYVESFYKKLYDWCEAHGCKLTGHSLEESSLSGAMLGGAGCMPTYEYEHIPGIDCLGRVCDTDLSAKQVGSVADQLGIKQVLTETFGCAGNDTTPRELKNIGELQYFNGVNLMCHHLYPYSLAGQAKHDHPPIFSTHSNWWEGFKEFNDYFTTLGYLVANTKEKYDVLVIFPMRSVYLDWIREEEWQSVKQLATDFENTLKRLNLNGVLYQLADERILSKHGRVQNGKLIVGNNEYTTVICPKMKNISSSTLNLLNEYEGKLLLEDKPSYLDGKKQDCALQSNTTYEEIINNAQIKFKNTGGQVRITARKGDIGEYIFIKNYSKDLPASFKMQGVAEQYKKIDLQTFELENTLNEQTLPACGSLILIKDSTAKPYKKVQEPTDITANFKLTQITKNYLVSDFCQISYDGKTFGEKQFVQKLFEDLLRADYKGKLFVKHTFTIKEQMPLTLVVEKGRFFSLTLNGKPFTLSQSDFDINYCEADITNLVCKGENVFVYGVDYFQHEGVHFALFDPLATESLRNCLYYDTHIENVYIKGDFVVNKDFSLSPREKLPEISTNNYLNGYPFFKGQITLQGEYYHDGSDKKILSLIGRYQMAEVFVNDKKTNLVLSEKKDITALLNKGKNQIRIVVYSSLRNLFGPHHLKREIEDLGWGISPYSFTMRGAWGDNVPNEYTPEHVCVEFGINKVVMITEK